jgi:hypothetical protein
MTARPAGTSLRWAVGLCIALVALVYLVSLEEEPYHIDELRQTRSYDAPLGFVIDSAFAQVQPPLDPVLNSLLQRVIGQGDWQQRALSTFSGLAGIGVLAALLHRRGMRMGIPLFLLVVGLSPLLVSVFVYARPYGLPLLLTTLFLYLADIWLEEARPLAAVGLFPIALLLPLSRTLEPNMVLGSVIVVLLAIAATGRAHRFAGSVWVPIGAAITGLLAVGIPVLLRLRAQLTGYTEAGLLPSSAQFQRLVTDLPTALAATIPAWPVALLLVGLALWRDEIRSWFGGTWWSWVCLLVPVGFILLFLLTTDPAQPLFDRYLFTWIPLLGLLVAVTVDRLAGRQRLPAVLSALAATVIVSWSALWLVEDLRTNERGDWLALSESLMATTDPSTVVLLESPVSLGAYRTPFAGEPRYLPSQWLAPRVMDLIGDPGLIEDDQGFVLVFSTFRRDISGWSRADVDGFFSIYQPLDERSGRVSAAEALRAFAKEFDVDRGGTLALAAAAMFHHIGDTPAACELLSRLSGPEDLASRAAELLEIMGSPLLGLDCAAPPAGGSPRP